MQQKVDHPPPHANGRRSKFSQSMCLDMRKNETTGHQEDDKISKTLLNLFDMQDISKKSNPRRTPNLKSPPIVIRPRTQ